MTKSAYSIVFDRVSSRISGGETKERRIDGFAEVSTARQAFAEMRRQYEERGFRLDHPRIVGPDGAVYAVD
jgi:hypothetical protein